MPIHCNILFDQDTNGFYYAGQTISGHVEVLLDETTIVKGVCLKMSGYAESKWPHPNGKDKPESEWYRGREDFIATKMYFIGSDENGSLLEVSSGRHTYNFSFALSNRLPTTYVGTYGHIRYTISMIFELDQTNQTYVIAFTVLNPLDLNLNSLLLKIPAQVEMTKQICWGPCRTGPFTLLASIPQTGYVAGQTIKIYAEVSNMSRTDINEMRFMIRRVIKYFSQTPKTETKEEATVIQEKYGNGVVIGAHEMYDVSLDVPPGPPTNTNNCQVLHIMYDVKVEATIKSVYSCPSVKIPITIGNIPLNQSGPIIPAMNPPIYNTRNVTVTTENEQTNQRHPEKSTFEGTVLADSNEIPQSSNLNESLTVSENIPPPTYTYEESPFGNRRIDRDEQHSIGRQLYTPRYPVFNLNET